MTATGPQVIAALVSMWKAAIAGVDVLDGPVVSGASLPEAITVGYEDTDLGVFAIEAQQGREGMGLIRDQYVINCSAASRTENDLPGARDKAFVLFDQACAAIYADTTLGGLVLSITPGLYSLRQQLGQGVTARVVFALEVDAYIGA